VARLLFEIGTEEIPPRFLAGAVEQLESLARERLDTARLSFGEIKTYATHRRLALIVEGLAEQQESRLREEQGPPAPRAFNEDGTPNHAAIGFARRWGVKPEDLQVRPTDRGDYLFAVFKEEGRPAIEVLKELLPQLPGGLYFPKTMRWGTGSLRFARPIRWLAALLDGAAIEFEVNGLKSGGESRGHSTLHPKNVMLDSAQEYEKNLRRAKVIIDQKERRRILLRQLRKTAKQEGALLAGADDLVEETNFLVEWPTAVCGGFEEKYLNLPRPVLMEEMRKVQGFFPLEDAEGKLVARFIGVRDGGRAHIETVRAGYEGVLRAKFEDAAYFFEHDRRRSLESRVEDLKGVVFQSGLGSLYDKAQRLQQLAGYLTDVLKTGGQTKAWAERAARLAKADLVTDMVVEVTSLQGIMGREYALADGEPKEAAEAVGEHYRPRFAGDVLPSTAAGRIVALADKLDTVVTGLAAGLSVSGSQDPYGLRREGQAIVSLLVEGDLRLSLPEAIGKCLEGLSAQQEIKRPSAETAKEAHTFLRQRLERLLEESAPLGKGVRYDLADAALAAGDADFAQAAARAEALQKLSRRPDFLPTVVASTRPANIVKGFDGGEPDEALFSEPTEKALWQALLAARPKAEALSEKGDYAGLFKVLSGLRPIIDKFFDDVLVMAEEARIRENRLALVWQVDRLFRLLADFRLVVQEGE
jgi:glycyl-tRNA synthetase beta chain